MSKGVAHIMHEMSRGLIRRAAVAAVAFICLGLLAWVVWPKSTQAPAWADEYDVSARPPETIAPGTVVGQSAPAGWSHLVIKSLPRVRPGEESKIPLLLRSQTVRMASWMFTAFTVDVRPEPRDGKTVYKLRAVGLGLGTASHGRDIVITPETAAEHGVELDWIAREILTKGYKTQANARVVIQGPSFALVDAPVWYCCGTNHRLVRFRYALLVDTPTGRLDVLVWLLDSASECNSEPVVILAPNTIDEAELIPDPKAFNALGIATDGAFAVDRLPPHLAQTQFPAALRPLTGQVKYTTAEARTLEAGLRRLLHPNP